jgi:hypothetical protein
MNFIINLLTNVSMFKGCQVASLRLEYSEGATRFLSTIYWLTINISSYICTNQQVSKSSNSAIHENMAS